MDNNNNTIKWAVVAVVIIGVALTWKKVLEKFGLIDSAEDKKTQQDIEENQTSIQSPFDIRYYKQWPAGSQVTLMKDSAITHLAKEIDESFSAFGDDEERIYGVFRALPTKSAVSQLSAKFLANYRKDLYSELVDQLSTSELNVINKIVDSLPSMIRK